MRERESNPVMCNALATPWLRAQNLPNHPPHTSKEGLCVSLSGPRYCVRHPWNSNVRHRYIQGASRRQGRARGVQTCPPLPKSQGVLRWRGRPWSEARLRASPAAVGWVGEGWADLFGVGPADHRPRDQEWARGLFFGGGAQHFRTEQDTAGPQPPTPSAFPSRREATVAPPTSLVLSAAGCG